MESNEQEKDLEIEGLQTIHIEPDSDIASFDEAAVQVAETIEDEPSAGITPDDGVDEESTGQDEEKEEGLPLDLMDIFESEEMEENLVVIPGLLKLTMNEVASETESVLEELRSRFPVQ